MKVGGPIATSSSNPLSAMFLGDYNFTADVYYDLKNEGYYSPKVFEAYVSKPVLEIAAAVGLDLDVTIFGVYQVKYKTSVSLLKFRGGFQSFLATRYLDNACLMGFGGVQIFSTTHELKTNTLQCINDLLENFTLLDPYQKMHNCQFDQL